MQILSSLSARVLVVGSTDSGQNTLCRLLLNGLLAVREAGRWLDVSVEAPEVGHDRCLSLTRWDYY